ncbi:hypothetical protein [Gimesia aquarii]|nr:hypothetical protein [Gimesia aquarii]
MSMWFQLASLSPNGERSLAEYINSGNRLLTKGPQVPSGTASSWEFDPAFLSFAIDTYHFLNSFEDFEEYSSPQSSVDARAILRSRLMSAASYRSVSLLKLLDTYELKKEATSEPIDRLADWAKGRPEYSEYLREEEFIDIIGSMRTTGVRETVLCYKFSDDYVRDYIIPAIDVLRILEKDSNVASFLDALLFVKLSRELMTDNDAGINPGEGASRGDELEIPSDFEIITSLLLTFDNIDVSRRNVAKMAVEAIRQSKSIGQKVEYFYEWKLNNRLILVDWGGTQLLGRIKIEEASGSLQSQDTHDTLRELSIRSSAADSWLDKDSLSVILSSPPLTSESAGLGTLWFSEVEILGTGITIRHEAIPLSGVFPRAITQSKVWPTVSVTDSSISLSGLCGSIPFDVDVTLLPQELSSNVIDLDGKRTLPWHCFSYRYQNDGATLPVAGDTNSNLMMLVKFSGKRLTLTNGKEQYVLDVKQNFVPSENESFGPANSGGPANQEKLAATNADIEKFASETQFSLLSKNGKEVYEDLVNKLRGAIAASLNLSSGPHLTAILDSNLDYPVNSQSILVYDTGHILIPVASLTDKPVGIVRDGQIHWYLNRTTKTLEWLEDEMSRLRNASQVTPSSFARLRREFTAGDVYPSGDYGVSTSNFQSIAEALAICSIIDDLRRGSSVGLVLDTGGQINFPETTHWKDINRYLTESLQAQGTRNERLIKDALVAETLSDKSLPDELAKSMLVSLNDEMDEATRELTQKLCDLFRQSSDESLELIRDNVVVSNELFYLEFDRARANTLLGVPRAFIIVWRMHPNESEVRFAECVWGPVNEPFAFVFPGKVFSLRDAEGGVLTLKVAELSPTPGSLRYAVVQPNSVDVKRAELLKSHLPEILSFLDSNKSASAQDLVDHLAKSSKILEEINLLFKTANNFSRAVNLITKHTVTGASGADRAISSLWLLNSALMVSRSYKATWTHKGRGVSMTVSQDGTALVNEVGKPLNHGASSAFAQWLSQREWYPGETPVYGKLIRDQMMLSLKLQPGNHDRLMTSTLPVFHIKTTRAEGRYFPFGNGVTFDDDKGVKDEFDSLVRSVDDQVRKLRNVFPLLKPSDGSLISDLSPLPIDLYYLDVLSHAESLLSRLQMGGKHDRTKIQKLEESFANQDMSRFRDVLTEIGEAEEFSQNSRMNVRPSGALPVSANWMSRVLGLPLQESDAELNVKTVVTQGPASVLEPSVDGQWGLSLLVANRDGAVKRHSVLSNFAVKVDGTLSAEIPTSAQNSDLRQALQDYLTGWLAFPGVNVKDISGGLSIKESHQVEKGQVSLQYVLTANPQVLSTLGIDGTNDTSLATLNFTIRSENGIPAAKTSVVSSASANKLLAESTGLSQHELDFWRFNRVILELSDTSSLGLEKPLSMQLMPFEGLEKAEQRLRQDFLSSQRASIGNALAKAVKAKWGVVPSLRLKTFSDFKDLPVWELSFPLPPNPKNSAESLILTSHPGLVSFSKSKWEVQNPDLFAEAVNPQFKTLGDLKYAASETTFEWESSGEFATSIKIGQETFDVVVDDFAQFHVVPRNKEIAIKVLTRLRDKCRTALRDNSSGRIKVKYEDGKVTSRSAPIFCTVFVNGVSVSKKQFDVSLLHSNPETIAEDVEQYFEEVVERFAIMDSSPANLPFGIRAKAVPDTSTEERDDWRVDVIFPEPQQKDGQTVPAAERTISLGRITISDDKLQAEGKQWQNSEAASAFLQWVVQHKYKVPGWDRISNGCLAIKSPPGFAGLGKDNTFKLQVLDGAWKALNLDDQIQGDLEVALLDLKIDFDAEKKQPRISGNLRRGEGLSDFFENAVATLVSREYDLPLGIRAEVIPNLSNSWSLNVIFPEPQQINGQPVPVADRMMSLTDIRISNGKLIATGKTWQNPRASSTFLQWLLEHEYKVPGLDGVDSDYIQLVPPEQFAGGGKDNTFKLQVLDGAWKALNLEDQIQGKQEVALLDLKIDFDVEKKQPRISGNLRRGAGLNNLYKKAVEALVSREFDLPLGMRAEVVPEMKTDDWCVNVIFPEPQERDGQSVSVADRTTSLTGITISNGKLQAEGKQWQNAEAASAFLQWVVQHKYKVPGWDRISNGYLAIKSPPRFAGLGKDNTFKLQVLDGAWKALNLEDQIQGEQEVALLELKIDFDAEQKQPRISGNLRRGAGLNNLYKKAVEALVSREFDLPLGMRAEVVPEMKTDDWRVNVIFPEPQERDGQSVSVADRTTSLTGITISNGKLQAEGKQWQNAEAASAFLQWVVQHEYGVPGWNGISSDYVQLVSPDKFTGVGKYEFRLLIHKKAWDGLSIPNTGECEVAKIVIDLSLEADDIKLGVEVEPGSDLQDLFQKGIETLVSREFDLPLGIRAEVVPDTTTPDVTDDWRVNVIFPEPQEKDGQSVSVANRTTSLTGITISNGKLQAKGKQWQKAEAASAFLQWLVQHKYKVPGWDGINSKYFAIDPPSTFAGVGKDNTFKLQVLDGAWQALNLEDQIQGDLEVALLDLKLDFDAEQKQPRISGNLRRGEGLSDLFQKAVEALVSREFDLPLGIRAEVVPDTTTPDVTDDWRVNVIFPEPQEKDGQSVSVANRTTSLTGITISNGKLQAKGKQWQKAEAASAFLQWLVQHKYKVPGWDGINSKYFAIDPPSTFAGVGKDNTFKLQVLDGAWQALNLEDQIQGDLEVALLDLKLDFDAEQKQPRISGNLRRGAGLNNLYKKAVETLVSRKFDLPLGIKAEVVPDTVSADVTDDWRVNVIFPEPQQKHGQSVSVANRTTSLAGITVSNGKLQTNGKEWQNRKAIKAFLRSKFSDFDLPKKNQLSRYLKLSEPKVDVDQDEIMISASLSVMREGIMEIVPDSNPSENFELLALTIKVPLQIKHSRVSADVKVADAEEFARFAFGNALNDTDLKFTLLGIEWKVEHEMGHLVARGDLIEKNGVSSGTVAIQNIAFNGSERDLRAATMTSDDQRKMVAHLARNHDALPAFFSIFGDDIQQTLDLFEFNRGDVVIGIGLHVPQQTLQNRFGQYDLSELAIDEPPEPQFRLGDWTNVDSKYLSAGTAILDTSSWKLSFKTNGGFRQRLKKVLEPKLRENTRIEINSTHYIAISEVDFVSDELVLIAKAFPISSDGFPVPLAAEIRISDKYKNNNYIKVTLEPDLGSLEQLIATAFLEFIPSPPAPQVEVLEVSGSEFEQKVRCRVTGEWWGMVVGPVEVTVDLKSGNLKMGTLIGFGAPIQVPIPSTPLVLKKPRGSFDTKTLDVSFGATVAFAGAEGFSESLFKVDGTVYTNLKRLTFIRANGQLTILFLPVGESEATVDLTRAKIDAWMRIGEQSIVLIKGEAGLELPLPGKPHWHAYGKQQVIVFGQDLSKLEVRADKDAVKGAARVELFGLGSEVDTSFMTKLRTMPPGFELDRTSFSIGAYLDAMAVGIDANVECNAKTARIYGEAECFMGTASFDDTVPAPVFLAAPYAAILKVALNSLKLKFDLDPKELFNALTQKPSWGVPDPSNLKSRPKAGGKRGKKKRKSRNSSRGNEEKEKSGPANQQQAAASATTQSQAAAQAMAQAQSAQAQAQTDPSKAGEVATAMAKAAETQAQAAVTAKASAEEATRAAKKAADNAAENPSSVEAAVRAAQAQELAQAAKEAANTQAQAAGSVKEAAEAAQKSAEQPTDAQAETDAADATLAAKDASEKAVVEQKKYQQTVENQRELPDSSAKIDTYTDFLSRVSINPTMLQMELERLAKESSAAQKNLEQMGDDDASPDPEDDRPEDRQKRVNEALKNAEKIERAQLTAEKVKRLLAATKVAQQQKPSPELSQLNEETKRIADELKDSISEAVEKVAKQLEAAAEGQQKDWEETKLKEPTDEPRDSQKPNIKRKETPPVVSAEKIDALDAALRERKGRVGLDSAKEGEVGKNSLTVAAQVLSASDIELTKVLKGFASENEIPAEASDYKQLGSLLKKLLQEKLIVLQRNVAGKKLHTAYIKGTRVYDHVFFLKTLSRIRKRLAATGSEKEYIPTEDIQKRFRNDSSDLDEVITLEMVELAMIRTLIAVQHDKGGWTYELSPPFSGNRDMSLTQSALYGIRTSLEQEGALDYRRLNIIFGLSDDGAAEKKYLDILSKAYSFTLECEKGEYFLYASNSNYTPNGIGNVHFSAGHLLSCLPFKSINGTLLFPNKDGNEEENREKVRHAARRTLSDHQRMIGIEGWKFKGQTDVDFPFHYQTLYTARSLIMYLQVMQDRIPSEDRQKVEKWTDELLSKYLILAADSDHPFAPKRPGNKQFHSWIDKDHQSMKTMSRIVACTLRDDLKTLLTTQRRIKHK